MKLKSKYFIATVLIIVIQVLIISYLAILFYNKYTNSQKTFVTVLNKNDMLINPDSQLKNYWEAEPFSKNILLFQTFEGTVNKDYQINSAGFNSLSEFTLEKPDNTFRIIMLGDSFTFGIFVKTSENYPEVLKSLITKNCLDQKTEVINLGNPMYDIRYSFERFRLKGLKYNPDLVIWLLKDDDFDRIQEYVGPKIEEYQKNGSTFQIEVDNNGQFDSEVLKRESIDFFNKTSLDAMKDFNHDYTPKQVKDYQLGVLSNYYKTYPGKTVFLTFPFTKKEYKDSLVNFSSAHKNTFVFELSDIEKLNQVFPDHHLNIEGHQTIAQDIFKLLTKNNLLSCNN